MRFYWSVIERGCPFILCVQFFLMFCHFCIIIIIVYIFVYAASWNYKHSPQRITAWHGHYVCLNIMRASLYVLCMKSFGKYDCRNMLTFSEPLIHVNQTCVHKKYFYNTFLVCTYIIYYYENGGLHLQRLIDEILRCLVVYASNRNLNSRFSRFYGSKRATIFVDEL